MDTLVVCNYIKIKIKIKQCWKNTMMCSSYRGCDLIVAKVKLCEKRRWKERKKIRGKEETREKNIKIMKVNLGGREVKRMEVEKN